MRLITEYITQQPAHILPGLVIGYQYGYDDAVIQAFGVDGLQRPLQHDTLFPVASITKLAVALAILRLVDQKLLVLDAEIGTYVPDIHHEMTHRALRSLLCHTSGYGFDLPNKDGRYAHGLTWAALAHECLHIAPIAPAYQTVQYSNLGYGLLGIIIERVTGQSCTDALQALVLTPLGIRGRLGNPSDGVLANIADVRGQHRGTDLETFNSPFWRSLALPWGGLCTDASGALALINAYMPHSTFLGADTRDDAIQNHTGVLPGGFMAPLLWPRCPWGLGVELRGNKQPHWVAPCFPSHSFGHTGASGMLVWADPEQLVRVVICGARVADGGWLLRHSPALTERIWREVIP